MARKNRLLVDIVVPGKGGWRVTWTADAAVLARDGNQERLTAAAADIANYAAKRLSPSTPSHAAAVAAFDAERVGQVIPNTGRRADDVGQAAPRADTPE